MGRRKRDLPEDLAIIWSHPRYGVAFDRTPRREPWQEVGRVRMAHGAPVPPLPRLPRGYLWANPAQQRYGLGGPHYIYGPIDKQCRDCKEPFVFTAGAQRGLYEDAKADLGATQVRCPACVHARRKLEAARVAYAEALHAVEARPSVANHHAAAAAALAVLQAGGRARIDRAIGHARAGRDPALAKRLDRFR